MKVFQCKYCKSTIHGYQNLMYHENQHRQAFSSSTENENQIASQSNVSEHALFREIEETEWFEPMDNTSDDIVDRILGVHETDVGTGEPEFMEIEDSSFHGDQSLVEIMNTDQIFDPYSCDFSEIMESTFHEGDSLLEDIGMEQLLPPMAVQYGGGSNDYNIKIMKEKRLKKMGAIDVNYQLTFNNNMFKEKKKMKDVLKTLKEAFKDMIERVKQDLQPGDIMRASIHNDALDVPIFVPCRPMEEMDTDAMLDTVINVLNSEEDLPFDSSCRVDVGAIKYPNGGKGIKIVNIDTSLVNKRSIAQIKNRDNL